MRARKGGVEVREQLVAQRERVARGARHLWPPVQLLRDGVVGGVATGEGVETAGGDPAGAELGRRVALQAECTFVAIPHILRGSCRTKNFLLNGRATSNQLLQFHRSIDAHSNRYH